MSGFENNTRDSDDNNDACHLFRVTGHVQGVFFRASTQTTALDLGLSGYAKNKPDGSVEVLACGGRQALEKLAAWLHEGPPMAQVSAVDVTALEYQELESFTVG